MARAKSSSATDSSANLGFEAKPPVWKGLARRGIETLRLAIAGCANRGTNRAEKYGVRGKKWPCANIFGPGNTDTFRRDLHPDLFFSA